MSLPADDQLEAVFGADGALSRAIPGYRMRRQQVEMAQAIAQAMRDNSLRVAEAGTGTGKTFAYLVPALLSGGKVIIATGTKNLQDQLYNRDLPTVRDALQVPVSTALLKGRANYVCHHHLEGALADGRFASREDVAHLHRIARFAKVSKTGDKAELADVPENASAWQSATSTRENCLGQDCRQYKECFVMAARREALNADIVVVNHHLFFADVMLKDEGMAELLPACNTVIFDEAHQLPETATLFFGESLSSGQLLDLCHDTLVEAIAGAGDRFDQRVVAQIEQLARAQAFAEKQRRRFGQLVRFVENHGVAGRQQFGHAFVLEHHIGEEKMMVDHDDVGVERFAPRGHDEALLVLLAVLAQAVLARRCRRLPGGRVLGHVGEFRPVARLADFGEARDPVQMRHVLATGEAPVGERALQVMVTDVIRAALEQSGADRNLQCIAHRGQIAIVELVLQVLGAGGNDDLAAREQRRHQVSKSLAGAGAGFGHQQAFVAHGLGDGLGHLDLLPAHAIAGDGAAQRAIPGY